MKKRYTISVAGYKMNVISDDSPADIQETVNALDRSVRTFCTRTRSLPLTEAAMLAGLEAYSEKNKAQRRVRELEDELYGENGEVARLRREISEIKRAILDLADEEGGKSESASDANDNDSAEDGDGEDDGETDSPRQEYADDKDDPRAGFFDAEDEADAPAVCKEEPASPGSDADSAPLQLRLDF